ncbi:MAG: hypothetical protein WC975_15760 [Phycisphaerae bacterium]
MDKYINIDPQALTNSTDAPVDRLLRSDFCDYRFLKALREVL